MNMTQFAAANLTVVRATCCPWQQQAAN